MIVQKENIEQHTVLIQIIQGTLSDLTQLDYSLFGLQFFEAESPEFVNFLKTIPNPSDSKEYRRLFKKLFKDFIYTEDKIYVLCPKDLNFLPPRQNYIWGLSYLLVICPSVIQIIGEMEFDLSIWSIHWQKGKYKYTTNESFFIDDSEIKEVNRFLPFFKEGVSNNGFLRIILENYFFSFLSNFDHLSILSISISFETLLSGTDEITFRLKRSLAILCGHSIFSSKIIYKNVGKLYNLRSRIIHGESYKSEIIDSYLFYARKLAACMIIELIINGVNNIETFNNKIVTLGFGDFRKLNERQKIVEFNIQMRFLGINEELPKFS